MNERCRDARSIRVGHDKFPQGRGRSSRHLRSQREPRRHGQFHRDYENDRRDFEREDTAAYGRSTEGIGDYGGYGGGSRGTYGEDAGRRWGSESPYGNSAYGNDRGSQSQSHRGKGPKGYQRSDERLKEVICERLSDDPRIDASEITLTVSGGTVKLTGLVDNRRDKFEVEELVSQCSGVKDVDNQLRVQPGFATGYGASGLDSASSGSRRPEATSTTAGLSSPAKKQ
ncbi:MAG TPA: BON domain-containing protein [Povalibacter sp.]|uniref:BON domain-containing protein n=1 Tax=Povalibacter sp. TaxID=1962978 RepID=UPI002C08BE81|nr:BON domain-containing protein [Povalibacter sp.]HMN46518.1 BON domain-containing protein [Povalibacter sp.]